VVCIDGKGRQALHRCEGVVVSNRVLPKRIVQTINRSWQVGGCIYVRTLQFISLLNYVTVAHSTIYEADFRLLVFVACSLLRTRTRRRTKVFCYHIYFQ
jgi:hypothetical protein